MNQHILVLGATGYVGGRLVPRLLQGGYPVRCLVRDPGRLEGRNWEVEVVQGDVLAPETLPEAMENIDTVFYLVHSLGAGEKEFEKVDQRAARNVARAAKEAGVKRIVYLGGLGEGNARSAHLKSRQEVGDILREEGPPVTEFRAAIVVGSGSVSFEMIRYLAERVPIMICPSWVSTPCQPIGIGDVLQYLLASLTVEESVGRTFDIGGADVLTYGEMMKEYARQRGLWRWLIPVPVLTPRLSSYWVDLVTPIPAAISRPLIEGLRSEVVCKEHSALNVFNIQPMSYADALSRALQRTQTQEIETTWSTPLSRLPRTASADRLQTEEGIILEKRDQEVQATTEQVYKAFTGMGGKRGWKPYNWMWRLRGFMDRLVGGVGMRRSRRHPDHLYPGEALDFWRVEELRPGKLLRLRAEMKVPGKAWLQFSVEPTERGTSLLTQTAFFEPKGLFGLMYWYVLYPVHQMVFSGMIKHIAKVAEKSAREEEATEVEPERGTMSTPRLYQHSERE